MAIKLNKLITLSLFFVLIGCTKEEDTIPLTDVKVSIPNAFTPNSLSGINDRFSCVIFNPNNLILEYSCIITDNSGVVVFKSTNKNEEWKGNMRVNSSNNSGNLLPENTYPYSIEISEKGTKRKSVYKGSVLLKRTP